MDHNNKILYLFDCEDSETMRGTQNLALKLWSKYINNEEIIKYSRLPIPLKWIEGSDELQIKFKNKKTYSYKDFFVSITPDDNAIEIDNIALINLSGDISLYDGEVEFYFNKKGIKSDILLNRIIGFFPVKDFLKDLSKNEFIPEFLFYKGEKRDTKDFEHILHNEYFPSHKDFRTKEQDDKYKEVKHKFNLCPITRSSLPRLLRESRKPLLRQLKMRWRLQQ